MNQKIKKGAIDKWKLKKIIANKKMTQTEVSGAMGRTECTVAQWMSAGEVPEVAMPILCKILECTQSDIAVDTETEKSDTGTDDKQLNRIEEMISIMRNDIAVLKEIITPDMLTNKDRAVLVLKQMMGDANRVEEHDYIVKCNELGIDEHSRKFAIEKIDAYAQTSEGKYSNEKGRYVPVCVKTEQVDGERIKEDTFYKLVDGEFQEV